MVNGSKNRLIRVLNIAVLVTGGAGFIGSHTVVELIKSGYEVVVIDNFANSSIDVVNNVKKIVGSDFNFFEGSCCDEEFLNEVFLKHDIECVVHWFTHGS